MRDAKIFDLIPHFGFQVQGLTFTPRGKLHKSAPSPLPDDQVTLSLTFIAHDKAVRRTNPCGLHRRRAATILLAVWCSAGIEHHARSARPVEGLWLGAVLLS